MAEDNKKIVVFLYSLLVSACILAICSKSSFLYPFNDGFDVNCFFTVGKSILNGKVLYRDIYEHKGLILYLIYAMAYLVSNVTFIGVYIIEVLCLSVFLYCSYSIVSLFVENVPVLVLPVMAALICSSFSFSYGGQTEELVLPLLSLALYISLDYFRNTCPTDLSAGKIFILGVIAGCILWTKYTMIGLIAGMAILVIFIKLKGRDYHNLVRYIVFFMAGLILVTIPVIAYFAVNHALHDLFRVYFYNLLFLYPRPIDSLWPVRFLGSVIMFFRSNRYSVLIVAGILWMTFSSAKRVSFIEKINIWVLCFFSALAIFGGGIHHRYYGLALAIFVPLGFIPTVLLFRKTVGYCYRRWNRGPGEKTERVLEAFVLIVCLFMCYRFSHNSYLMKYSRGDMPQYRFRNYIIRSGIVKPRILNYGALDVGLYTVCDVVPACKYFCDCNINLPELKEGQRRCISEGMMDYVVTINSEIDPAVLNGRYTLADQQTFELEFRDAHTNYYLYELIRRPAR